MSKRILAIITILTLLFSSYASVFGIGDDDAGTDDVIIKNDCLVINTGAVAGTSGIRYKTLGYKATFNKSGKTFSVVVGVVANNNLQQYIVPLTKDKNGIKCIYNMLKAKYTAKDDQLKIADFFEDGGDMQLDAVMTVTYNGTAKGGLNTNGTYWGNVYDTAAEIIAAPRQLYGVEWSAATKAELPSHFTHKAFPAHDNLDMDGEVNIIHAWESNGKLSRIKTEKKTADYTKNTTKDIYTDSLDGYNCVKSGIGDENTSALSGLKNLQDVSGTGKRTVTLTGKVNEIYVYYLYHPKPTPSPTPKVTPTPTPTVTPVIITPKPDERDTIWRTRVKDATLTLPIKEIWSSTTGITIAQPAVYDGHVYQLTDTELVKIKLEDGTVEKKIKPEGYQGNKLRFPIQIVENKDGRFVKDKHPRIVFGSGDVIYCYQDDGTLDWTYKADQDISSAPVFIDDAIDSNRSYIAVGMGTELNIIDSSGALVKSISTPGKIVSCPIITNSTEEDNYDTLIYPIELPTGYGYFAKVQVVTGESVIQGSIEKDRASIIKMKSFGDSPCLNVYKETLLDSAGKTYNKLHQMIYSIDKNGSVYGFSITTGKLMFVINDYKGSYNVVPSLSCDGTYLYATIGGRYLKFDIDKAVVTGRNNSNREAYGAVVQDTKSGDITGYAVTGPYIVNSITQFGDGKTQIHGKVAFVADSGKKLHIFNTLESDSNYSAVPVQDAFIDVDPVTSQLITATTMNFSSGIATEIQVADGYLLLVDGNGVMHALIFGATDNLALLNISNSKNVIQPGKKYETVVDVLNYSDYAKTTDLTFYINGEKATSFENINIPTNGYSAHLQYTVPQEFKDPYLIIRAEVNPATTNGKRKLLETDYSDNSQELRVKASTLLDLSVVKPDVKSYSEKRFITTNIQFKNTSLYDLKDIPIEVKIDGKKLGGASVPGTVAIKANSTISVPVTWYTGDVEAGKTKSVVIEAAINRDFTIAEQNEAGTDDVYDNNVSSATMTVKGQDPSTDFILEDVYPDKYHAGQRAMTMIKVTNNSALDYVDTKKVSVKVTFAGTSSKTYQIDLRAHGEANIPVTWTTPDENTSVQIMAEVNPDRKYNETNYSNNKISINAQITKDKDLTVVTEQKVPIVTPPPGCTNYRYTWTEDRFDHWERVYIGSSYVDGPIDPDTKEPTKIEVKQYEDRPVFRTYSFYSELIVTAKLSEVRLSSGYGFEATVTTSLNTNYDKPSELIGPQAVYAYFPESQYKVQLLLEPDKDTKSLTNTWHFFINGDSVLKKRNHYIPIWFPDNAKYEVQFIARYAQSPGGQMCNTTTASLVVDGNMYQHDNTGVSN